MSNLKINSWLTWKLQRGVCVLRVCACTRTHARAQKPSHVLLPLFPQGQLLYHRFLSFTCTLFFSLYLNSSLCHASSGGPVTSLMKGMGKQLLFLPDSEFLPCPAPFCSFYPLPSQRSPSHLAPTVWDYFPVCGKENSSASNPMPFLDPNTLAAKEMQANTIKPSREPATLGSLGSRLLLTFHPSLLFSSSLQRQANYTRVTSMDLAKGVEAPVALSSLNLLLLPRTSLAGMDAVALL